MSAKDYTVWAQVVRDIIEANGIEREQNPVQQFAVYGCVAIEHEVDDRVDLLTYDLAHRIATTTPDLEETLSIDPVAAVRQIIADLEPTTRHLPTRSITFWNNVGLAYRTADLTARKG